MIPAPLPPQALPPAIGTLPIALFSLLLAALAWLGLELLTRQFHAGTLGRVLLQRSRLSISATLLVGGLGWWLLDELRRLGWELPREGRDVRDVVISLGIAWTLLRCKAPLIHQIEANPRWLPQRSPADRRSLLDLTDKLLSTTVLLLAALVVLQLLGVSPALLLTASGIGAAAVGFGAKALVENLLSGVMIYVFRPFTVGDWIELPDRRLAGTVRAIGSYYTELLTAEREPLFVPNALFAGFAVANGSRRDHRRLLLEVSLRPEDAERAAAITAELRHTLAHHPAIDQLLPQRVHVSAIDQRGLLLRLEAFGPADREASQNLRQELLLALAAAVRRHGAAFRSAQDGADPP
ncbi:MAG: mechanosensitive ion channel family protein [Cyanobium sp.]